MNQSEKIGSIALVLLAAAISYVIFTKPHAVGPDVPQPVKPGPAPVARLQVIYVSSKRCSWCDKMDKDTFQNPKVKERLARDFTFSKVQGKEAAERFKVTGYPTTVILGADGTELRRATGYRGPDEFLAWLDGKQLLDETGFSPPED